MPQSSSIGQAQAAFGRGAWREAFTAYAAAGGDLDAADHERMAVCAYLLGRDDACTAAWEAAYRAALAAGDRPASARCACWLGLCLLLGGRPAQAGGWFARAGGLLDDGSVTCPAAGYLLVPQVLEALGGGEPARARDLAATAAGLGERFADPDLRALGALGHGQALIALGEVAAGTAWLDEAMVAVTAAEVGPITAGIVYCAVILECMQIFDLARASEWTGALGSWCDAQPDVVPFRGQCLVHRSQLQQAEGDWPEAFTTAAAARARLADPPHPALGLACYQVAELHRLAGAHAEAEAAYREASRHGHQPLPGLALLALDRGDVPGAVAMIERALQEPWPVPGRPALLAAAVDVLVAGDRLPGARAAAGELAAIAAGSPSPVLRAAAAQATATVLVAEAEPAAALAGLRAAAGAWRSLRLPYEAARVSALLAQAYRALGDQLAADLELDNARRGFAELGAVADLARLPVATPGRGSPVLSDREREVLGLVCQGRTNREIAAALAISRHTVGRHLENIFAKLGVSSRAAATAYAYEHDLR
ncbi:MAG TPA: helix-turn-helix transcriptional regulator [Acidimicrobiales bacterium]|nr:helix-turn-helix transcriptional regulator [Acidimicrobiales bacterium]